MKKILVCLMVCFLVVTCLPICSFAETELNKFTISEFIIEKIANNKIFGRFEVKNLDMKHYEEINYTLYLIPQEIFEVNGQASVVAHSSEVMRFSLSANEEKLVAFEYAIPNEHLLLDEYVLGLRLTNEANELSGLYSINDIPMSIGSLEKYIIPNDNNNTHYYKIKNYEVPMSGPYIDPGKEITAYIDVKSTFDEEIKVRPKISFYKRLPSFGEGTVYQQFGEEISLKPNKSKEIAIKLPKVEIPESYFVKVQLVDNNNKPVSYEYNFRYVINGETAKISEISTMYDEFSKMMKVFINYIGSSDGKTLENVEFTTGVYETESGKVLEKYINNITLPADSYVAKYSVKIPESGTKVTVFGIIKIDDKILASKKLDLSVEATSKKLEKFNDIKDTNYEIPVKMLNSYGVISGYPNGTFKPQRTLTRAELTSIALNMNKVDLTNYEVENNAFTDVPTNHWAYKAINYAYSNGIINGYGNGLFKPDKNVTYAEAVTILLNNTIYKDSVEKRDEVWPNNYIGLAKDLKLDFNTNITDFSEFANRGEISILTLNSFVFRKE